MTLSDRSASLQSVKNSLYGQHLKTLTNEKVSHGLLLTTINVASPLSNIC